MTSLRTQFRECQYSGSEVEKTNPSSQTHTHTHVQHGDLIIKAQKCKVVLCLTKHHSRT